MDFRRFYDEHMTFVWQSLWLLGVRHSDLEDALQDVHVVVFRKLPDFEPGDNKSVRSWLFAICHRTAQNYRRRAHLRREILDEKPMLQAPEAGPNGEEELRTSEDIALVQQALSKLDVEQRTVLVQLGLRRMTGKQIADTLNVPVPTVYSRFRLAREAFRRAMHTLTARQDRALGWDVR